jgi:hypothetical protein
MIDNAKLAGKIKGLVPNLIEGGLTHLQYANDTIIFLNMDDQSIIHTKFLLYCFENMSGLKINYQKSEVFVLGCSEEEAIRVAQMLNCNTGHLPLRYLGVLVHDRYMTAVDLNYVAAKVEKGYLHGKVWVYPLEENDISVILFEFNFELYNGSVCSAGGSSPENGYG